MTGNLSLALTRIFLDRSATWRLLGFTVCGFAFSLAVILGTIGLMDGFESALKGGLRRSAGDAQLTSRQGFFKVDDATIDLLQQQGVRQLAPVIQSEGFALSNGRSKAVMVRGVDSKEFSAVTGLLLDLEENEVAVGSILAEDWGLNVGDRFVLVLARGQQGDLPQFIDLKVAQVANHGMYEKDNRLVYVPRTLLNNQLALYGKTNLALLSFAPNSTIDAIEGHVDELERELESPWSIRTSWNEFGGILEAVAVEKRSIAIVLQLIVLVAVFNIAAFLITLRTRKAQEYFLLRAVGLPRGRFFRFGAVLLLVVWLCSCAGAWLLIKFFNWLLAVSPWLRMPGDVYLFTRLQVLLDPGDYLLVFGPALLWVMLLGWGTARKLRQQSLLTGLRSEFA